jgi:hypothetical protein
VLKFSDSRIPNVLIASLGSCILFVSALIGRTVFVKSEWSSNFALMIVVEVGFAFINVCAFVLSIYALITVFAYRNAVDANWNKTFRAVIYTAPNVILYWVWQLLKFLKAVV